MELEETFALPSFFLPASTLSLSSIQHEQASEPALSLMVFNKALV